MREPVQVKVGTTLLELTEADLTELPADAIVNPANSELVLGGGVAGAIRARGGPGIQEECNRLAPVAVGEAVITGGGTLPARRVIHAVGPRWGEGDEEEKLAAATRRALELGEEKGIRWLALPAISTGVFGFPMDRAATIMLGTAIAFLVPESHLERVTFCLRGEEAFRVFAGELARHELEAPIQVEALARHELEAPIAAEAELPAGAPIQVEALLFAAVREVAGVARVALELPARVTAGAVLEQLIARYPALAGHRRSLRLAVNAEYVDAGHPLQSGDEVALIPPTCGG